MSQPDDRQKWINLSVIQEMEIYNLQGTVAALAAENERLRKAGDAMAFNYEQMHSHDGVYDSDLMKFVNAWNAAKEGRDAK